MIQVSNVKIICQYTVQYKNQKVIQQDAKDRTKKNFPAELNLHLSRIILT